MQPITLTLSDEGGIKDVDFVQWIMNEIEDRAFTRADVAKTYAILIEKSTASERLIEINKAIIKRWSPSALKWIKEQAWKQVNTSVAPKAV